jgi:hypothetical protein
MCIISNKQTEVIEVPPIEPLISGAGGAILSTAMVTVSNCLTAMDMLDYVHMGSLHKEGLDLFSARALVEEGLRTQAQVLRTEEGRKGPELCVAKFDKLKSGHAGNRGHSRSCSGAAHSHK